MMPSRFLFARSCRFVPSMRTGLAAVASLFLLPLHSASCRAVETHDIAQFVTKVNDLEATIHVPKYDSKEGEKIGKDFGVTYRLRRIMMQYKQPDCLRLESHSPVYGSALLIMNGATRYYSVPKFNMRKVEDLNLSPGKRQSLLEIGVVAPDTLRFMQGKWLREEVLDGQTTQVYDLTYTGGEGGHQRCWIDAATHVTNKREWYGGDGKLRATFAYSEPKEVGPGIFLPTRLEVKNTEGIVAAVTTLSDVKINQGLSDDLFAIKR